jgi:hypothetical protein
MAKNEPGQHHTHLPRWNLNKAWGIPSGATREFEKGVARAQGRGTKDDAKTPPRYKGGK